VFANGFVTEGSAMPEVVTAAGRVAFPDKCLPPETYDGYTGRLNLGPSVGEGHTLFGCGFGFPEVWDDVEGHSEQRVGFNTVFVEHVQRIIKAANGMPSHAGKQDQHRDPLLQRQA
jgi:hypothetical protein